MEKGVWTWPPDPRGQRRVLRTVSDSPHVMPALQGIVKSKEGMSNPELDELLADNSNWMTLWVVRQLLSLGFIEYRVDLFGGPARYVATDLGRSALSAITRQPSPQAQPPPTPQPQPKPSAPSLQQPAAPKPAPPAKA